MIIDYLVILTAKYGYFLALFFGLVRLILLQWFKPGNVGFLLNNFFFMQSRVSRSTREMDNPKWPFFLEAYKMSSYMLYSALFLWIFLYLILHAANPSLFM